MLGACLSSKPHRLIKGSFDLIPVFVHITFVVNRSHLTESVFSRAPNLHNKPQLMASSKSSTLIDAMEFSTWSGFAHRWLQTIYRRTLGGDLRLRPVRDQSAVLLRDVPGDLGCLLVVVQVFDHHRRRTYGPRVRIRLGNGIPRPRVDPTHQDFPLVARGRFVRRTFPLAHPIGIHVQDHRDRLRVDARPLGAIDVGLRVLHHPIWVFVPQLLESRADFLPKACASSGPGTALEGDGCFGHARQSSAR